MAVTKSSPPIRFSALRERREELSRIEGQRLTQEDIAARSGDAVSQRTVSHLEAGTIELGSLAATRLAALARALKWTLADLQEATGVDLGIIPAQTSPPATTKRRPTIPAGLQAAIEIYGKRFADLLDPIWQDYLARFNWREGQPDDPEAWLDLYRDLTRAGVIPGEN